MEPEIYTNLSSTPISIEELISKIGNDGENGAISVFSGITRNNFDGKKVVELAYEAYDEMALKQMRKIANEAIDWFQVTRVGIEHRLGIVPVGEASVNIVSFSPHRKSAIEATSWLIDELKTKVPIWKKEIYDDETSKWKENKEFLESFKLA